MTNDANHHLPFDTSSTDNSAEGTPSTALMWMHITWLPLSGLVSIIIWFLMKDKHPQVRIHAKNILNAFYTFFLFYCLSLFFYVGIFIAMIAFGIIDGKIYWGPMSVHGYSPNPLPFLVFFAYILCMIVFIVASSITVGKAARKGRVVPYWWTIRFYKI